MDGTILIVDDNAELLDALSKELRASGYEVFAALGTSEAFTILRTGAVRVLITDMQMEDTGGDGAEVLEEAEHAACTPFRILLTGADVSERQAKEMGADLLLRKPADCIDIEAAIRYGLDRLASSPAQQQS